MDDSLIESIANNYENGNLSDVEVAFKGMNRLMAAAMAIQVYLHLEALAESGRAANNFSQWLSRTAGL